MFRFFNRLLSDSKDLVRSRMFARGVWFPAANATGFFESLRLPQNDPDFQSEPLPKNVNDVHGNHRMTRKADDLAVTTINENGGRHRIYILSLPCSFVSSADNPFTSPSSHLRPPRISIARRWDPRQKRKRPSHKKCDWSVSERIAPPLPSRRMLRSPNGYGREAWGARSVFQ